MWAPVHGGAAGTYQTVTLNAGELITAMTLAAGLATGMTTTCVCYIKIETSQGRTFGPYDAGCGSAAASRYSLGSGLSYFSGRYGTELDALILNYCGGTKCSSS